MTTEQAAEYLGYGSVEHLEKNDISDRSEWWELIKKLTSKDETELNLHIVSKCTEVNLVVFEEYTRCYKVTDSELEKLIEDGDIEEGDIVCKVVVIKNY